MINICLSADNNFAQHSKVTITSALKNATDEDRLYFHVLDGGISEENKQKIMNLKKIRDFDIEFIRMRTEDFIGWPIPQQSKFNETNYFRIMIPKLLPLTEKTIYLDSDTIVITSLKGLYDIDIDGYYIAAAETQTYKQNKNRIGIPGKYTYINSGVMLINCKLWRENEVEKQLIDYIRTSPLDKLLNVDQDAINSVLYKSIKLIDQRWNAETRTDLMPSDEYRKVMMDPYIIHYCSGDKPWNPNTKQNTKEYKKYLYISESVNHETQGGFLNTLPQRTIAKRFGFGMQCYPDSFAKYENDVYEEMTALFVRQMSLGIQTFVDIGANIGFYSILIGLSNPKVKIFSFEPIPELFNLLRMNLLQNTVNANIFQNAVSDKRGNVTFQVSNASDQSGFLANPDRGISTTINVDSIMIDDFFQESPQGPILIKIDTEGNESKVLAGMQKLIEKFDDIRLVIEINPTCLEANGSSPSFLLNQLDRLGFDVFVIFDMEMKYVKYLPGSEWNEYMGERSYRNLYCAKKNRTTNVLIFSHSSQLAGSERSMLELVTELTSDYGAISTVVLPSPGPLVGLLQEAGAATLIVPLNWWCADAEPLDKAKICQFYGQSFGWLVENLEILRQINPDVVLTNTMVIPWGALAASLLKRPHVWMINEFGELDHGFKFFLPFTQILRFIDESSDKIVTRSMAIKKELFPQSDSKKVNTIYRFIDIPVKEKIPDEFIENYFSLPDACRLIISGTVMKSKGQEDAVSAVIELVKNRKRRVELVIAGYAQPDFQDYLQEIINAEGVSDYIHIFPFQENIISIVYSADIVLVCSRMEGFGRVTLEAMLMEKAIIATNTGGTTEMIINEETGLLYTPGNYLQLADQIEKLLDNPIGCRKLAQNARQFASITFTREKYGGEYHNVILDLKNKEYKNKEEISWFLTTQYQELIAQENIEIQTLMAPIAEIRYSKAWRVAMLLRQMRVLMLPPGSWGARLLKKLITVLIRPLKILQSFRIRKDVFLLYSSDLFDQAWYLAKNPDVAKAKVNPVFHYLRHGGFEGRDPSPNFSSRWYLDTYSDVREAGINPLVHYLKSGMNEGRKPRIKSF